MPSRRLRLHILTAAGRCRKCSYCGRQTNVNIGPTSNHDWQLATFDHILPRAHGGGEEIENILLACKWCNAGRAIAGHCIGALRCAEAVLGTGDLAAIAKWFRA
jgi:5-methylcytosine-specific restriction endonuclease McrA